MECRHMMTWGGVGSDGPTVFRDPTVLSGSVPQTSTTTVTAMAQRKYDFKVGALCAVTRRD